jgi:hypothetical protein
MCSGTLTPRSRGTYYSHMASKKSKEEYAVLLKKYNELVAKYEVSCGTIDRLEAKLSTTVTTPKLLLKETHSERMRKYRGHNKIAAR